MSFGEILLILRNVFVPDLWRFVNMAIAVKNRKRLVSVLSVICHDYLYIRNTEHKNMFCRNSDTTSSVCYATLQTFVISSIPLRLVIRHFIQQKEVSYVPWPEPIRRSGERFHGVASAGCISSNCCNNYPSIADNIPRGLPGRWPAG